MARVPPVVLAESVAMMLAVRSALARLGRFAVRWGMAFYVAAFCAVASAQGSGADEEVVARPKNWLLMYTLVVLLLALGLVVVLRPSGRVDDDAA
jgi:hypothetical protein